MTKQQTQAQGDSFEGSSFSEGWRTLIASIIDPGQLTDSQAAGVLKTMTIKANARAQWFDSFISTKGYKVRHARIEQAAYGLAERPMVPASAKFTEALCNAELIAYEQFSSWICDPDRQSIRRNFMRKFKVNFARTEVKNFIANMDAVYNTYGDVFSALSTAGHMTGRLRTSEDSLILCRYLVSSPAPGEWSPIEHLANTRGRYWGPMRGKCVPLTINCSPVVLGPRELNPDYLKCLEAHRGSCPALPHGAVAMLGRHIVALTENYFSSI